MAELFQKKRAELQVGNFIGGTDIVDLPNQPLVKDSIESIGSITRKEITAGVLPVAVEKQFFTTVEEAGEFGNNLYTLMILVRNPNKRG